MPRLASALLTVIVAAVAMTGCGAGAITQSQQQALNDTAFFLYDQAFQLANPAGGSSTDERHLQACATVVPEVEREANDRFQADGTEAEIRQAIDQALQHIGCQ